MYYVTKCYCLSFLYFKNQAHSTAHIIFNNHFDHLCRYAREVLHAKSLEITSGTKLQIVINYLHFKIAPPKPTLNSSIPSLICDVFCILTVFADDLIGSLSQAASADLVLPLVSTVRAPARLMTSLASRACAQLFLLTTTVIK